MKLLDILKDLALEQVDPATAASAPQKCAATDARNKENSAADRAANKENAAWDKEVSKQNKADARETALRNKNFLSLSYDRDSDPLDKATRREYYAQYQNFMKTNPGVLNDSDGLNTEQQYAVVSKTLDFIKRVPQISYTKNLGAKFNVGANSTIADIVDVVSKMGGWVSYLDWFNSGGRPIK